MTLDELFLLIPQLILLAAAAALMLMEPFGRAAGRRRLGLVTVAAVAAAAYALQLQWGLAPRSIGGGMIRIDGFSLFFQWLFLVIAGLSAVLSADFNQREGIDRGEYYALLLTACSGMSLAAMSEDLILTFIGIEILSLSTYILAGFKRRDIASGESSLKYFLLGSFATAILLYGIALVYGATGSTEYQAIRASAALEGEIPALLVPGLGLLLVGVGFKIGLVPFHSWIPDVYEGAPSPVTAFMAVGPKAAGIAALMRILAEALPGLAPDWTRILWLLAVLTMTLGNAAALVQSNIKRMLAYSAIAQAGYILVGVVVHTREGFTAALFYLVVYTVMSLVAFGVVLALSGRGDRRVHLDDYAGLGRRAPYAAAAMGITLLALAGIPLTGGFMGKFYLFGSAVQAGFVGLAVIAVLNSVLSVFYYFRVLVCMYMKEAPEGTADADPISRPVAAVLAIGVLLILWLGVSPDRFLALAGYSSLGLK
jgi:NADH-quinone oxidoreductase subunit N